ncbi:MAG TPA: nucleotidyltransferase family protein [Bacteriovoracaceae bacterium]|nr:nucleotidyltransferase family protein [Bacteriovoracaceae bacterium]
MNIVENIKAQKNVPALLKEHLLTGLFYNHFIDSVLRADCRDQYKKQWIHNQLIIEQLDDVNRLAAENNLNVTILKGSHLLLDLYPDLGSRFLSDIDLLIDKKDQLHWESILIQLGFSPIQMETFHGNNFKSEWSMLIGEIEINIELHTKLFFHLKNENWPRDLTSYSHIQKLKSEELFIHLCGHLASQHTFLKLYWMFDIYFYYQKYYVHIDWHGLKKKSIEHDLFRSVQMCLWILKRHFNVKLERDNENLFSLNKKHWWERFLTMSFLMYPLSNKLNYFIIKHATKDRFISALRYDLTWFFHYKFRKAWLK